MNEENTNILSKTWFRSVEPVIKAGYMEGATDGQAATFQSSFDVGYKQGLKFGLQLGFNQGLISEWNRDNITCGALEDIRRINCQLCINGTMTQEKVDNLYNKQEERNDLHFEKVKQNTDKL